MAMTFTGAFGTWAVDEADMPDYIQRSMLSPGSLRRSYYGTARRRTQYDKWAWALSWTMVGTTARTYAAAMAASDGSFTWAFGDGTYTCMVVPGSYADPEAGYGVYNLSMTVEQV